MERKIITGNYKGIIGKDRTKKLDLFEKADMQHILKKINGGKNV